MSQPNEKLIDAKQKLARDKAAKGIGTGHDSPHQRDRLPAGQRLVSGWPVLDLGLQPEIPVNEWMLEVLGAAQRQVFSWADFLKLPQTKLTTDFHCVTSWSIFDSRVEGVLWSDFMAAVKADPHATHVMFHSYDGYSTNVPLKDLNEDPQAC